MTFRNIRLRPGGERDVATRIVEPWLRTDVLEKARTNAVRLVKVDTGYLRSTIATRIERPATGQIVGILEATADYALWQETEPGDAIPGYGTRQRPGGRPYLRPAVFEALRPYRV